MAEHFGFFNSNFLDGRYDREYDAGDFAGYFSNFISNGVFAKSIDESVLNVSAMPSPQMKIRIGIGKAWINGYWYFNDTVKELEVQAADSTNTRIDAVAIRLDLSSRTVYPVILAGTPNVKPTVPEPTRNEVTHDLILAHITIQSKRNSIMNQDITDKRSDNRLCGWVHGVVDQVDTTTMGNQLNDWIQSFEKASIKRVDDLLAVLETMVDKDAVGHLTNEITKNREAINTNKTEIASNASQINTAIEYIHQTNDYIMELDGKIDKLKDACIYQYFLTKSELGRRGGSSSSGEFDLNLVKVKASGKVKGKVHALLVFSGVTVSTSPSAAYAFRLYESAGSEEVKIGKDIIVSHHVSEYAHQSKDFTLEATIPFDITLQADSNLRLRLDVDNRSYNISGGTMDIYIDWLVFNENYKWGIV